MRPSCAHTAPHPHLHNDVQCIPHSHGTVGLDLLQRMGPEHLHGWTLVEPRPDLQKRHHQRAGAHGRSTSGISFTIESWGEESFKVRGDLGDFCAFARKELGHLTRDDQRDPHVRLFERKKRGGGGRPKRGELCSPQERKLGWNEHKAVSLSIDKLHFVTLNCN